jgi:hypothetical protein
MVGTSVAEPRMRSAALHVDLFVADAQLRVRERRSTM